MPWALLVIMHMAEFGGIDEGVGVDVDVDVGVGVDVGGLDPKSMQR